MTIKDEAPYIADEKLVAHAREARQMAHAPYSMFPVGAALFSSDGKIFTGCNLENSSYSLTMCAERVAIFKAASEGVRKILKIAVVADTPIPVPPCGSCRQMIWEFGTGSTEVVMANIAGQLKRTTIEDLLPNPFDPGLLPDIGGKMTS
ncbi:MAG TPA: cytidine deaminase [Blastocatellia bacterium]|nr:cytidine deaminase [Blastocatellia bacterium]